MNGHLSRLAASAVFGGVALVALTAPAQEQVELRFTCYGDANECEVTRDLLDGFEAENPGITVALDKVPYKAILESLPVQLAAGEGPDMARVTDLGGLNKYYLDLRPHVADAGYWEQNFGPTLEWMRVGPDDDGIYGMMTQLTITGPYANKTLFEQAGVEMPGEGATWDDWAEASAEVAEATGTQFAMAMDRSGHRFAGPAISMGAKYFDEEGNPAVVDEGFRQMAEKFVAWNQEGVMAKEVWGGQGGAAYQDAAQEFINGNLVLYMSGSWQIPRFDEAIGDFFDWQVVPNPCGPAACTGIPGGAAMVGFKGTEHPEAVAKVLDYMAREDVYAELMGRTLNIPAHQGLIEKGIDYGKYGDVSEQAQEALQAFTRQVDKLSPTAYAFQGYRFNRPIMNATVARLSQAIVGEMSLDEALERLEADVQEAVEQSKQ